MQHLRDALKPIERKAFARVCCPEGHVIGHGEPAVADEDILAHAYISQCACFDRFLREDMYVQRGGGGTYLPMYASVHREDLEKLLDCWEAHNVH
jgi:hypothetical protein